MPRIRKDGPRVCRVCGASENEKQFCSRKTGSVCRDCFNAVNRKRYASNREQRQKQIREYAKAHPEAARAASRRYRESDPERHASIQHEWYLKNKERLKEKRAERRAAAPWVWQESTKRWRESNRDKTRAYRRNRGARERGAGGSYTPEDIAWMFNQQGGKCGTCRTSIRGGFHVDHIVPIIRGGSNSIENLQLLCPLCNRKKGAKTPEQWAQENGRLF